MGTNKGVVRTTITVVIMVVLVLGYYAYISNRKAIELQNTKVSEADRLILEDIEGNYPKKPRDVVKLHVRMLQQIYAAELDDDKLSKMVDQMRRLYDDRLLNNQGNSKEEQLSSIRAEIDSHDGKKYKITNYDIDEESQTLYSEVDGEDVANLYATYTILDDKATYKQVYLYVLVKDKDGHFKILGWQRDNSKESNLSNSATTEKKD